MKDDSLVIAINFYSQIIVFTLHTFDAVKSMNSRNTCIQKGKGFKKLQKYTPDQFYQVVTG